MLGGDFLCDFSTKANSSHAGTTLDPFASTGIGGLVSDTGHIWQSSSGFPGIAGGLFVNQQGASGGGYGFIDLIGRPKKQSATLIFGSGTGTVLSCSNVDFNLNTMVHCQVSPTGLNFQIRRNGWTQPGNGFISIYSYNYTTDPTLFYTCSIEYNGNTAIITAVDGTVHYVTDSRIGMVIGRYLMFQANTQVGQNGGIKITSCTIAGRNTT